MPPAQHDHRLRQVVNTLNGSTALGIAVARLGGATLSEGPQRTVIACSFRWMFPRARAFTLGNVVTTRLSSDDLMGNPRLVAHELRHCTQYAWCLGPLMLPLYAVASAWSWLRTGDPASRNVFERHAGLADGGYLERPLRPRRGRRSGRSDTS